MAKVSTGGQGVDWWAVGVMIFQMMTGHPPSYYDEHEDWDVDNAQYNLEQKILNDEVVFTTYVAGCRIDCDTALDQESSTATRVNGSVDTVRQHSFFKGIDWQALQEKRLKTPEKEKVAKKKPEEYNQSFSKVLKLFQGFYFINYRVKRG